LGNDKGNSLLEAVYDNSIAKPNKDSDTPARTAFIQAKYAHKQFVNKYTGTPEQHQAETLEACNSRDILRVMECLMQGVDPNFIVDVENQIPLLSQVVMSGSATTYILELLIQNGSRVCMADSCGWTPLHYAVQYDIVPYVRILVMHGAVQTQQDNQGNSPVSIAQELNSQTYKYFNKEIQDEDLEGVQPNDMNTLKEIKCSFSAGVDILRSKLNVLRQELQVTDSVENANEILKQLRLIKLALYFDSA